MRYPAFATYLDRTHNIVVTRTIPQCIFTFSSHSLLLRYIISKGSTTHEISHCLKSGVVVEASNPARNIFRDRL